MVDIILLNIKKMSFRMISKNKMLHNETNSRNSHFSSTITLVTCVGQCSVYAFKQSRFL